MKQWQVQDEKIENPFIMLWSEDTCRRRFWHRQTGRRLCDRGRHVRLDLLGGLAEDVHAGLLLQVDEGIQVMA